LGGRVVLVGGGARGIGYANAEQFQSEGAQVFLLDCDHAEGSAAAKRLNEKLLENSAVYLPAQANRARRDGMD